MAPSSTTSLQHQYGTASTPPKDFQSTPPTFRRGGDSNQVEEDSSPPRTYGDDILFGTQDSLMSNLSLSPIEAPGGHLGTSIPMSSPSLGDELTSSPKYYEPEATAEGHATGILESYDEAEDERPLTQHSKWTSMEALEAGRKMEYMRLVASLLNQRVEQIDEITQRHSEEVYARTMEHHVARDQLERNYRKINDDLEKEYLAYRAKKGDNETKYRLNMDNLKKVQKDDMRKMKEDQETELRNKTKEIHDKKKQKLEELNHKYKLGEETVCAVEV